MAIKRVSGTPTALERIRAETKRRIEAEKVEAEANAAKAAAEDALKNAPKATPEADMGDLWPGLTIKHH